MLVGLVVPSLHVYHYLNQQVSRKLALGDIRSRQGMAARYAGGWELLVFAQFRYSGNDMKIMNNRYRTKVKQIFSPDNIAGLISTAFILHEQENVRQRLDERSLARPDDVI